MISFRHALRQLVAAVAALLLATVVLSLVSPPAVGDQNEGKVGSTRLDQGRIAAGDSHTCVLVQSGNVWCWGANNVGQLGNGTTAPALGPVKVTGLPVPAGVPGELVVTALSAGFNHTCALLSDQTARCWGDNNAFQLGTSSVSSSATPLAVPLTGITALSSGAFFNCAVAAGAGKCWGANTYGQLGTGSLIPTRSATPVTVTGLPLSPSFFALGHNHSCVVVSNGTVYCRGQNNWGQLGPGFVGPETTLAIQVPGPFNVSAITAGFDHTCISGGGSARCWGRGSQGQMGNGGFAGSNPNLQTVSGLGTLESSVAAGGDHTCARMPSGLRCWGLNFAGQLGNGGTSDSAVPVNVAIPSDTLAVTAGSNHSCALRQNKTVRCWGRNNLGQLGQGPGSDHSTPVVSLDLPGVPLNVTAKPGNGAATVTWSPPSSTGGTPVTGYRITASPGGQTTTVAGNVSTATVAGLTNGQSYTLYVMAISEVGEGFSSGANSVTPSTSAFFEINDVSIVEGNSGTKVATFTVTRYNNLSGTSSVKYASANGSAQAGPDYTAKAATLLTFTAGQTTKPATVTIKGELLTEYDEAFFVDLTAPVNGTIVDSFGVGTIVNDDAGEPPAYSVNSVSITEGDSLTKNMTFTVTRSGSTAVSGSVKYQTYDAGATAGSDYTAKPLTALYFNPGQSSRTFTVSIKGDLVAEPAEYLGVVLTAPVNGSIANAYGYGLILNDDSSAPTTVSVNDGSVVEGAAFGGRTITFTITRSGNLAGTTTVKYATANGTAVAPGDYAAKALTSVTFSAGQTTKTFAVSVVGNAVAEPTETFQVLLSAPTGATISDGTGIGTIVDDD